MKNGAVREAAGLSLASGVRLSSVKLRKGMVMKELVEMVAVRIAGGEGEIGRERGGRCMKNADGNGGTAEAWAGKGMVMKELVEMVAVLIAGGEGEIGKESGGGCMKDADGDGGTVEARAGKGKAAGDEESCIAGAGGSSARGVLERTLGGWDGGTWRCARAGGGVWGTEQVASAGDTGQHTRDKTEH